MQRPSEYNPAVSNDAGPPSASGDSAELSSIATVLDDLQSRVVEVADRWRAIEREDVSGDLYDVERSLRSAQRRIQRALNTLR